MFNGLRGTHIATGYPVDIPLNGKEMQLAMAREEINMAWCDMCISVESRGGPSIIDEIEIDFIVVQGNKRVFH